MNLDVCNISFGLTFFTACIVVDAIIHHFKSSYQFSQAVNYRVNNSGLVYITYILYMNMYLTFFIELSSPPRDIAVTIAALWNQPVLWLPAHGNMNISIKEKNKTCLRDIFNHEKVEYVSSIFMNIITLKK